jgi:hypothetical protein
MNSLREDLEQGKQSPLFIEQTLTTPRELAVPLLEVSSTVEKENFPNFLLPILHVLAKLSSACPVSISSQSRDLALENESAVTGGNFRDVTGIENDVAFLESEPDP